MQTSDHIWNILGQFWKLNQNNYIRLKTKGKHGMRSRETANRKWKWSCSVVSDSLRPMDCSPQSSSIHGILQARILEWVAISFSRGSSGPRDRTQVSHIAGRRFNLCATREAKMSKKALLLSFSAHCLGWRYPQEELIRQSVKLGQSRGRWGERVTALALC